MKFHPQYCHDCGAPCTGCGGNDFFLIKKAWTPAEAGANLSAWYDTTDPTTITESFGAVSQLDDKSGNNQHLTQANSANQPNTGSSNINLLNAIHFNNGKYLEDADHSLSTTHSILMVAELETIDNVSDSIVSFNAALDYQIDANHAAQFNMRFMQGGGISSNFNAVGGPFPGPSIYEVVLDSVAQTVELLVDGLSVGSTNNYTTPLDTVQSLKVFANRSAGQKPTGSFAEMIIFNIADTALRQKAEGYLAHKFGLEALLPAGHPYKTQKP